MGCCPCYGVAQSQTRLKRLSMHACIGEGHGNPLQYSCLENPRDRGACGLPSMGSQSWTRLKQLSSSSSPENSLPCPGAFGALRVSAQQQGASCPHSGVTGCH